MNLRPENPERPMRVGQLGRLVKTIEAVNPVSCVCEESIFVNAVTTLGIPLVSYTEFRVSRGKNVDRIFQWVIETRSIDGKTELKDLVKWWNDPQWLALNPGHELAVAKVLSENLLRMTKRMREQVALVRMTRQNAGGRLALHLPANLTDEELDEKRAEYGFQ